MTTMADQTPPTNDLDQLKRALSALKKARARITALEQAQSEPIAIVGMACRLPGGANTPQAFWQLLRDGRSGMIEAPADRWDASAYQASTPDEPGKLQSSLGGFIDNVDRFDPQFFGIAPREANAMDPQQRLTLEVAWEALEDAGIIPADLAGSSTAVFIGIGLNDYGRLQIPGQAADPRKMDNYFLQGNALCITANRVSYALDFQGPSMAIDTACSSSLVALHTACASLRHGDASLALVGGSNLMLAPDTNLGLGKFLAPDGLCKTFDSRANGYTRGEGCIILVLKKLSTAIAASDRIYAIIRGSAINQDGFSSGLTVPNGTAQENMLRAALNNAGLKPGDLDYVEAHGTGTALGDPIEANALGAVFASGHNPGQELLIGSVKTNIGHLEAGAGIAGVLKVVLGLVHREIPPSLNYIEPNPMIDFPALRLKVVTQLTPWPRRDHPPRAGVSSFGFGGTNAHVIIEAAPPQDDLVNPPTPDWAGSHLLTLSAKTPHALVQSVQRMAEFLRANPELALTDVCHTTNRHRSQFAHRLAVVCDHLPGVIESLSAFAEGKPSPQCFSGQVRRSQPKIAFLFTGQGAQYEGMGLQLYQTQAVFRSIVDRCDAIFQQKSGESLLAILYPHLFPAPAINDADRQFKINQTAYTQPALFAVEYALAQLWRSWGVKPAVVMGHSIGEYVAACIAEVMSLEDGMKLITARGRLMGSLPEGGMMAAVFAPIERVRQELSGTALSIGAINAPDSIVISGAAAEMQQILHQLAKNGIKTRTLVVSHAFHSSLMEPILDEFERVAGGCQFNSPKIPLISNVSGRPFASGEIPDAAYWRKHMRASVNFAAGMTALQELGIHTFLEIGPNPVLINLGERCLAEGMNPEEPNTWLPSLRQGQMDEQQLQKSLAALFCLGQEIDWSVLQARRQGKLLSLPTYPFQRERFWFQPAPASRSGQVPRVTSAANERPLLGWRVRSPLIKDIVYETRIDAQELSYLWDHRAYRIGIFPATAFIEMALEAGSLLDRGQSFTLEDLTIQQSLILPEVDSLIIQLVITPENDGTKMLKFFSSAAAHSTQESGDWTLHASAKFTPTTDRLSERPGLPQAQDECQTPIDPQEYYQFLGQLGMEYGPAFQNIHRLWRGESQALAHIQLPEFLSTSGYAIHPALLDACVQTIGASFPGSPEVFLPLAFEHIDLVSDPGRELWSHVRIYPGANAESFHCDLTLFGVDQQEVGRITGLRMKRATQISLQSLVRRHAGRAWMSDWLYRMEWHAHAIPSHPSSTSLPSRWLILADTESGTDFAALVDGAVFASPSTALLQINPHRWTYDPTRPEDFNSMVQASQPDGIVSFIPDLQTSLHLLQAACALPASPRIWLTTLGSQPVLAGASGANDLKVAQAALVGLTRSTRQEYPDLRLHLVDLDPASLPLDQAHTLWQEIQAQDNEYEVAYRNDMRYVSRLERLSEPSAAGKPLRLEIAERGTFDSLTLRPMQPQALSPGEVEIEVRATGLNFRDVLNTLDMYPGDAGSLGHECSGIIHAVASDVTHLRRGDAVLALANASFATYAHTKAEFVVRKPVEMSFEQAATIPITFLTAEYALNTLGNLRSGERILIHAAAGGVGMAAVQLAQLAGAEIFATAGSPEKRALLQSMGVPHVMDSRSLAFADQMMRETGGEGVDVVLNSLTDDFITASFSVLRAGGRFLEIGKRGVWSPTQVDALGKNIAYHLIYLGEVTENDPQLIGHLLRRLMAQFETNALHALPYRAFPIHQATDAFRFMGQARHVGKIVLTQPSFARPSLPKVDPDCSYLITGGLGGIGLSIAAQLVAAGARHLILVGRRPPSAEAQTAIARLQANTPETLTIASLQADVSDRSQVQHLLEQIQTEYPRLAGIVHAAGLLNDGVLDKQNWARFAQVLAPKLDAALHLHHLTAHLSLDFFVLFSAGAGWLGTAGQSGYAAANTALDALAYYRNARGLPAVSIAWGPWSEVGMAARMDQTDQDRLSRQGIGMITMEEGMQIFENLRGKDGAIAVLPMNWQNFAAAHAQIPTRFHDLTRQAAQQTTNPSPSGPPPQEIVRRLAEAPLNKRKPLLQDHLSEHARHVLGLSPTFELNLGQPLREIGMDSLMAVELRNAIANSLQLKLPSTLLFDYPTIDALTAFLTKEIWPPSAPIGEDGPLNEQVPSVAVSGAIHSDIQTLSDDEAEALLLAELEKHKRT